MFLLRYNLHTIKFIHLKCVGGWRGTTNDSTLQPVPQLRQGTFPHPQKVPLCPFAVSLLKPTPTSLSNQWFLLLSINFHWSHIVSTLLYLTYFVQHNVCEICYVAEPTGSSLSVLLSTVLLHENHNVVIYSPVNEHLGCFQFLAIMT